MTKKSKGTTTPALPKFAADKQYRVTLSKKVQAGRVWLRPGEDAVISGKIAETISESIASAELVS